jgi:hypothetical protein
MDLREILCFIKKPVQIKNKPPIVALRKAISNEGKSMFLTKTPMLPKISMVMIISSFPFTLLPLPIRFSKNKAYIYTMCPASPHQLLFFS